MKYLFSIAVAFLFIVTGCGTDKSAEIVSAPAEEQNELNIGPRFSQKILPPSPTGPTASVVASLDTLFPILGATQTVMFAGNVSDFISAWYTLTDEYGQLSDSGSIVLGAFAVPALLSASANANDTDGRMYIFTVTAVGTLTVSASDTVIVPYIPANDDDDSDDDGDDDDDEDNDNCGNGHHGKNHHKHHWKCEKCGKHNHSSYNNHWKCKKCDWKHDREWKCKKCGKHHERNGNKDNCKKKGRDGRNGRGG